MRRPAVLLMLSLMILCNLHSQTLRTLRAEFSRTTRSAGGAETVQGTLFFKAPDQVILVVRAPVTQWVVFEAGSMLIWYPDSGKAWRFTEKRARSLGFASLFVGVPLPDFGLAAAGFTLTGSQMREGALLTRWKPPRSLARAIGEAVITARDRTPLSLELIDGARKPMARVLYSEFVPFGSQSVPSRVEMTQTEQGATVSEEILFSGHDFNAVLPAEVERFHLPPGVIPEETEW